MEMNDEGKEKWKRQECHMQKFKSWKDRKELETQREEGEEMLKWVDFGQHGGKRMLHLDWRSSFLDDSLNL